MDPQDWIDFQLDELPHEKCKEYGMYSPRDTEEYNTKFPTCEHVANVVFEDKSKGSWCPFGAHSSYGPTIDEYDRSDECTGCPYYKKRTSNVQEIAGEDLKDWKFYTEYNLRKDELEKKFGKKE